MITTTKAAIADGIGSANSPRPGITKEYEMTNGAITRAMPFITVGAIGIAVGSWLVPHNQAPPTVEYRAPAPQSLDPRLFPGLVADATPAPAVAPAPVAAPAPVKPLVGAPVSTAKAAAPVAPQKAAAVPTIKISMPPPVTTTITTTPKTSATHEPPLLDDSHGTVPDNPAELPDNSSGDHELTERPSSGDSGSASKSVKVEQKSSGSKRHKSDN